MNEYGYVALVLLAAGGWWLVRMLRRDFRMQAAGKTAIAKLGFVESATDAATVRASLQPLHGHPEVEVADVFKLESGRGPVYWYSVRSAPSRHDEIRHASEEFLLPLERKSAEPLVLFLRPTALENGAGAKLLEALIRNLPGLAPTELVPLTIPAAWESGLVNAFGPAGRELYDLIDDRQLTALRQGARFGFFGVRMRGAICALEVLPGYARRTLPSVFDLGAAARFAQTLAERNG